VRPDETILKNAGEAVSAGALVCRYGVRPVLRGIDLELARGESLAVLGANGAGKTTLLRVLAGLLRPRSGEVRILGEPLPGTPSLRSRVGLVMHEGGFYADLSARENLMFFAAIAGLPRGAREARVVLALEEVDLGAAADRRAGEFSRGMKQRLAIARALLGDPELLLLDEPFSGLDRQGARGISELLAARRAAGTSLVMVLHELEHAAALAGHALVLADGRVGWAGATTDAAELARTYDRVVGA
jgi:heme exporter protein A